MTNTLTGSPPDTGGDEPPRPQRDHLNHLWLLARRVHFTAGLLVAPFLVVLAVTGLAYAFTPQINSLLYAEELFTAPRGDTRPVGEQVDAALAKYPDAHLDSVLVPGDRDRTTQVVLHGLPGLEEGEDHFSAEALTVYVDPYTSAIKGELVTVNNRPPAQVWLRELHGNLNLGEPGRLYSEFVASWLPFIVLGGLVLWIGRRRRRGRALLVPSGKGGGRARTRSWHGVIGLWLAAGLLVISATGLTWSKYAGENVDAAVTAIDGKSPRLAAPGAKGGSMTVDQAIATARDEGLEGGLKVIPATEGRPFEIAENDKGLPIRKKEIAIDPGSRQVTARQDWADYPLAAKLTTLGIEAHSGTLLGLLNQVALATLAVGALTLLTLGYRMWWRRRPTGARVAPVLRRLPVRVVIPLVAAVAVLGWLMPVFGVTLVLFALADSAIKGVRRQPPPRDHGITRTRTTSE